MISDFVSGAVAGLAVAMPVGAVGSYLVGLGARERIPVATAAALGVASVDGGYAVIAALGGAGLQALLSEVSDPQRFGVPAFENDRVVRIEEKPEDPKSQYAVIGVYMYDNRVFDIIKTLKPSGRGELEITDVNNAYIESGDLSWDVIEGWWTDAGTFDSLLKASNLIAALRSR